MHRNTSSWSKLTESSDPSLQAFIVDGTQSRLASLAAPANYDPKTSTYSEPRLSPRRSSPIIDWGLSENLALEPSLDAPAVAVIAQELLDYVNTEVNSGDEDEERSDGEEEMGEVEEPMVSVFSQRQLDLFIWLLKVSNVDDVPSVKSMQELNAVLHNICGTESIAYDGALAICPNYCTEDSGKVLEEARQCKRWLEELPAEKTTPMARFGNQDYCIHEPAMLRDGTCLKASVAGKRREGAQQARISFSGITNFLFVIVIIFRIPCNSDDGQFWRVVEQETEVSEHEFMKNLPDLRTDFHLYGWPDPSKIHGATKYLIHASETHGGYALKDLASWLSQSGSIVTTRPEICQRNGMSIFLFTPAGLSREQAAKEFNIHFLCTSNIAPVYLISLTVAGIASRMDLGLGLACWVKESDALEGEADKPQASESHAGLDDVPADSESEGEAPPSSPAGQAESDAESDTSQTKKKRGKRVKETLEQMVDRVKSFMKTVLRQYSEPPFPDWWGTGLRDKLSWTSL
ncbi:hypothetical protein R3P38DRAFT_2768420 [Favolaschia claudopus]|uniref:Uncharacterized protein n=1 Tax=Favolaschia claudopus TaxID=2862362 RepID=A0AAW0CPK0_9AGAR